MDIFELAELPIEIKQGSTLVLPIYYQDKNKDVIDLSQYTAKLMVRDTPESTGEPDIVLTTENGGIEITGTSGLIIIKFLSAETIGLDENYSGTWDLWLIPSASTAFALIGGTFKVIPSTTRPIS